MRGGDGMAGPDWFKVSGSNDAIVYALSDEQAGRVFKAALWYFKTGEAVSLDPVEQIVFVSIRRDIDLSKKAYAEQSERNREKALKRWQNAGEK